MPLDYTLNPRQKRLYADLVNLYEPNGEVIDPTTKEANPNLTYTLAYENVPALMILTQNVSDPIPGVGAAKRALNFTFDGIHMHVDQRSGEGWVVQYAGNNALKNTCWHTKGTPQLYPSRGRRRLDYRAFELATAEGTPTGVVPVP